MNVHWLRAMTIALFRFGIVSLVGLALDFAIFLLANRLWLAPAPANMISASIAVSFVFFASVRRIFLYHGRIVLPLFAAYAFYQVIAVIAASLAVGALSAIIGNAVLAKVAVLPATFGCNFAFMALLTRNRDAAIQSA